MDVAMRIRDRVTVARHIRLGDTCVHDDMVGKQGVVVAFENNGTRVKIEVEGQFHTFQRQQLDVMN